MTPSERQTLAFFAFYPIWELIGMLIDRPTTYRLVVITVFPMVAGMKMRWGSLPTTLITTMVALGPALRLPWYMLLGSWASLWWEIGACLADVPRE